MRILVDSSVWVDFFRGQMSREVKTLKDAIIQGDDVYLSPTILQEVLQGFKHEQDYRLAKELLMTFPVLTWDPIELAVDAAQIYRSLRKKGITVSTSNDCLIAAIAKKHDCLILTGDKDYQRIAEGIQLSVL